MKDKKKNQASLLTRQSLAEALMELLETKPLSAVSITELTSLACVSRMTYYRNYSSIDDIFATFLEDILDSYRQDVMEWTDKGNYCEYKNMLHCYAYFLKHKDFISCLLKCGMGDLLLKAVTDYVISTYYTTRMEIGFYYILQAFSGSLYNVYVAWIQNDTRESAEELAGILCGIYRR